MDPAALAGAPAALASRHWCWGWRALWAFLCLGVVLEALHGFKDPSYLGPSQSTRRLMWTLAHAHGTLLGLIQLAFAAYLGLVAVSPGPRRWVWASGLLLAAQGLLPLGFLLGGWFYRGGDPGVGVFLVPVGAACLVVSVGLIALAPGAMDGSESRGRKPPEP